MDVDTLVKQASDYLQANYVKGRHHVAAALKTKSAVYLALHLDTKGFDVCAEPITVSNALAKGDTDFESIVAVIFNPDGTTSVISPCGNCRQILLEYAPDVDVIINSEGTYLTKKPAELLPFPY